MSGTSKPSPSTAEGSQGWAALDKRNERLVDASHPLLAELRSDRGDADSGLQAAG